MRLAFTSEKAGIVGNPDGKVKTKYLLLALDFIGRENRSLIEN